MGDLLLIAWIALWIWIGTSVHDGTTALATPSRKVDESATGLSDAMNEAAKRLEDLPVVGDEVAVPFNVARDAASGIATAGRDSVNAIETLAVWLGVSTAAIPILLWASFYLPTRYHFVRRAGAGQRFIDANADLDLFALRALATQPMHVLARIDDDPAGAWRAKDPRVIRALGELELRDNGLRPPKYRADDGSAGTLGT